ncbi:MAG: EAL domain-containing protein [Gammaproteobacteria bacterium]|jgi:diguanylate cyclase (GGDEF)-like protein/PAS domain S-box-containing protein
MFDTFAAPVKILLLSDQPAIALRFNALLSECAGFQAVVTNETTAASTVRPVVPGEFDLGVIWLSDVGNVNGDMGKLVEALPPALPLILVSDHEILSPVPESLRQRCVEHVVAGQLTAPVLSLAIGCIVTRHQQQVALAGAKVRYSAVLDTIVEGVVICNGDGVIDAMNAVARQMFAIEPDAERAMPLGDLIDEPDQQRVTGCFGQTGPGNAGNGLLFSREVQGRTTTGAIFPMELRIRGSRLSGDSVFTCVIRDMSLIKQKEQELQLAATAFETHTAILITDVDGTILRVNPAFTHITGYSAREAVGKNPKMLQSGYQGREFYDGLWDSLKRTGKWEGEIWNKRKNGDIYPEYQTITAVRNKTGELTHYVATFQDITERKQAQALIEHQAFYDALTNLPNRRMIIDRLNQEVSSARRHDYYGAVLFLDLDRFKTLNDSMGHAVGDALLRELATRLSMGVRKEDTVARLGGDEFVLLLPNLSGNKTKASSMAGSIATKLQDVVCEPYLLEGQIFNFTSSIGITLYPFRGDNADDILKHADTAMYRSKKVGGNTICFYKTSMQIEADKRLQLEKELREAIDKQQLILYYQSQFNRQRQLVGVEALIRWNHPERGIVGPNDFIALAEETNLIQTIGTWVLQTAIGQLRHWQETGLFAGNEYMAVNISPRQLQAEHFVNEIAGLLDQYSVPPACLKLELTESMLLHDLHDVMTKMTQLKELGVTFSLDDFGTGFSSLSYLKRLPFDQIKIDKTFIRDVSRDINDAAIVETIIAMAEHLKLDVIAEGVETHEELEFLQGRGCSSYQGFYFSKPMAASALERALQESSTEIKQPHHRLRS